MKKRYIEPETTVVNIALASIVAASVPQAVSNQEADEGSQDAPVNFARGTSIWSDGDE